MILEHTVRAKYGYGESSHLDWCCENLVVGTWKMRIGFIGTSTTYCFTNAEDLTAFKLRFNLKEYK